MTSRKITDYTELTLPANNDMIPIVDVSETLASDKNKKITIPNLTSQLTAASTSVAGIVQLNDTTASTSTTLAATANAVKTTYDLANGKATLTQGTVANSTSGTSVDFTGLPSGIKRITLMLSNVSTSGTSAVQVQLGTSGGVETTSYVGGATASASASAGFTSFTSGFVCSFGADTAATTRHGSLVIANLTGNTWTCQGILSSPDITRGVMVAYSKALGGTLTQVRITTVNGTDTFDSGTINILYER